LDDLRQTFITASQLKGLLRTALQNQPRAVPKGKGKEWFAVLPTDKPKKKAASCLAIAPRRHFGR
jgi:predicted component of type VI protein secretion system